VLHDFGVGGEGQAVLGDALADRADPAQVLVLVKPGRTEAILVADSPFLGRLAGPGCPGEAASMAVMSAWISSGSRAASIQAPCRMPLL